MSVRDTIGIAIDRAQLRVVCMRNGSVVWTLEAAHDPVEAALGTALRALLARAPRSVSNTGSAIVSFGPAFVQVRRLDGFPAVAELQTRARILQEGSRRWFLMRPGGLLTAGPIATPDEAVWGAAFERSAVEEVRAAVESSGLRVQQVVPTVTILGETLSGGQVAWGDGVDAVLVQYQDGRFAGTMRATADDASLLHTTPRANLGALGRDASHLADALAAASLSARREIAPLAIVSAHTRDRAIAPARSRRALLAGAISACALLGTYPMALWREHDRLTDSLAAARTQLDANASLSLELARTTEALDAIVDRQTGRRTWISPLAALSQALPAGTAAVTLRADTTAAVVVIVGPGAGAIVDQLERAPEFVLPTLVGPVTSEVVSGKVVERATIGFTLGSRRGGSR
jgi:hypothetical protein